MKCRYQMLVIVILLFAASITQSSAQLNYNLDVSKGDRITGRLDVLHASSRAGSRNWGGASEDYYQIPFIFVFNGTEYDYVSISSAGYLVLGIESATNETNNLSKITGPTIAPFWDNMRVSDGEAGHCDGAIIQAGSTGSFPNRIFVVEWENMTLLQSGNSGTGITFQVRFYEGTNKIEFYYDKMDPCPRTCAQWGTTCSNTTATVGIGADNTAFLSVTPNGDNATSSKSTSNNTININGSEPISNGVLYTFCPALVAGNVSQGGTDKMIDGDVLFTNIKVTNSTSASYQPFTVASPCAATVAYAISGLNASEYSITPASAPLGNSTSTPTITFSPKGIGARVASLTVRDNLGYVKATYRLEGEGTTRLTWIGNLAEGGTQKVADGDTLFKGFAIDARETAQFMPLSISVLPGGKGTSSAAASYTIFDPSGQFSISPKTSSIAPGATQTPVITFNAIGVGYQEAVLTASVDGETRRYLLRIFSRGSGADFVVAGEKLGPQSSLFANVYGCSGIDVSTVAVTVTSVGDQPFLIYQDQVFSTDTIIGQGTPGYPLRRDNVGNPIPLNDYFISAQPGSNIPVEYPIILNPGEERVLYFSFIANAAGKRFARAFFLTSGQNFTGVDPNGEKVEGMLNFDLFGRGQSPALSDNPNSGLPKQIVFPPTDVRNSSVEVLTIHNNGSCDLRISRKDLRLVTGDVNEFEIISAFPNTVVDASRDDYVLAPGLSDDITVRFMPVRSGSRRATIWMRTNDSLIYTPGISERGAFYLNVFGKGKVGLESRDITVPPAVIGGQPTRGTASIENTSTELVQITNITVIDPAGEFTEDMFPSTPINILPGKVLPLRVTFTPATGSAPGVRTATVRVILGNGDTLFVSVTGLAGTRTVNVTPAALFQGVTLSAGQVQRRFGFITNTGTFPVVLQAPQLTGNGSANYSVRLPAGTVIEPGQTYFMEVTYAPQVPGPTNVTLTINSNATNAPHTIMLGGTATEIRMGGDATGNTSETGAELPEMAFKNETGAATTLGGVVLYQSVPNPASNNVIIAYYLPESGNVQVSLYNAAGSVVRELESGTMDAGDHTIRMDVSGIPSGRYQYRLLFNGKVISRAMSVVK